jgi:hypothetical protein
MIFLLKGFPFLQVSTLRTRTSLGFEIDPCNRPSIQLHMSHDMVERGRSTGVNCGW